jgi:transcriptional regulator with XRE-family HTH domain
MYALAKLDGEVLVEMGEKLRALRKQKRYSQAQLAERIGVSRKHMCDIEAGRGTTLLTFIKLLKEFRKSDKLLEILSGPSLSPKDTFEKEHA